MSNPAGSQPHDAVLDQDLGKNIRDDFEDVFNNNIDFGGTFSFHKEFPNAPNPWLNLARLGTVGLPLSVRDAAGIKAEAKQAPFGMGERTAVDKKVRDTWEMDASEVTIENPKWEAFIDDVVERTCRALGVDSVTAEPSCELYKLLLYEEGSHFLPHVDTEKQDGMFATIIIVLPSAYTGGAAHLTHNGQTVIYDCSKNSKTTTTAMAWYTDITHEIKPVESGYRLALSYNLIRTTRSLRPPIQSNERMTAALDRILQAWAQNMHSEDVPAKLIYRLDHSYSKANLNGSALKGFDAQRVALLQPLAEKHGFRLGLAQLNCNLTGIWDQHDDGYKSDDGLYKRFVNRSIHLWHAKITHLVNLNGEPISDALEYWLGQETVPKWIARGLQQMKPDKEKYEEFTGNDGGKLDRWYHRAVLVIWPGEDEFMLKSAGQRGLKNAYDKLTKSLSGKGEARCDPMDITTILRQCEIDRSGYNEYAEVICEAAVAWDDLQLWERCVRKCKRFHELWNECKWAAIEKWGFKAVQKWFDHAYADSDSAYNAIKVSFLLEFIEWLAKYESSSQADQQEVVVKDCQDWIAAQVQGTMDRLKQFYPKYADDRQKLFRLICASREESLGSTITLNKITDIPDADTLKRLVCSLKDMEDLPEGEVKSRALAAMLKAAISKSASELTSIPSESEPPKDMEVQWIIKTCMELHCEQFIPMVLTILIEGVPDSTDAKATHEYAQKLLGPLVHFWTTYEPVLTHALESLENLRNIALDLLLDSFVVTVDPSTLEALLKVAIKNGQTDLLTSKVIPRLKAASTLSESDFNAALENVSWKDFGVDKDELRRLLATVFEHDGL